MQACALRVRGDALSEDALRRAFSEVGPLSSVHVSGEEATVTFRKASDAERAARTMNMSLVGKTVVSVELDRPYTPQDSEIVNAEVAESLCVIEEGGKVLCRASVPLGGLPSLISLGAFTQAPEIVLLRKNAENVFGIRGHKLFDREALADLSRRLYASKSAAVGMVPPFVLYVLPSCPEVFAELRPWGAGEVIGVLV